MGERPELHVVDAATGELKAPNCPQCESLAAQIAGLERDIRGWRHRYRELERDVEAEARGDPRWKDALGLFDYWRQECEHPGSRFTEERFLRVVKFIEKDGLERCRRAILGCSTSDFHMKRGKHAKRDGPKFTEFERIFDPRDRSKFERFLERAPRPIAPDELHRLAGQFLMRIPEDDRPTPDRIFQAVEMAQHELRRRQ